MSSERRSGQRLAAAAAVVTLLTGACGSSPSTTSRSTPAAEPTTSSSAPSTPPGSAKYSLGQFPDVPTQALPAATAAALQRVLDSALAEQGLPGVTATVLSADAGAWSGAAGKADDVHPVEVHSQFEIASLTKTVIAAEVMRLAEEGALRLSDPVADHLPKSLDFDTNGATIGNLLAMESGIPEPDLSPSEIKADPRRYWHPEEVLATVPDVIDAPGEHFAYSNSNYILLGLVVAEATGKSVPAALRAHILADPGLAALVYQPDERPKGPLALPFLGDSVRPDVAKLGGYLPSKSEASSVPAAGNMASDSGAVARWAYLLFGRDLLTEKSLIAMTDFGAGADYDGYGLGVFDMTELANAFTEHTIGNGGWEAGGYASIMTVLPGSGVAISVLTNTSIDPEKYVLPIAQQLAATLARGEHVR
jgi:D-alanyl-D-alanine carboxypeptidase